jgi:hypothetical protein
MLEFSLNLVITINKLSEAWDLAKLPVAVKIQNTKVLRKNLQRIYIAGGAVTKVEKRIFIETDVSFANNGLWWWWP